MIITGLLRGKCLVGKKKLLSFVLVNKLGMCCVGGQCKKKGGGNAVIFFRASKKLVEVLYWEKCITSLLIDFWKSSPLPKDVMRTFQMNLSPLLYFLSCVRDREMLQEYVFSSCLIIRATNNWKNSLSYWINVYSSLPVCSFIFSKFLHGVYIHWGTQSGLPQKIK